MLFFILLNIHGVFSTQLGPILDNKGDSELLCMDCFNEICQNNYSCRHDSSQPTYCYTYWTNFKGNTAIDAAGCYGIDDNCKDECIAYSPIARPQIILNEDKSAESPNEPANQYFCCCKKNNCNQNFMLNNDSTYGSNRYSFFVSENFKRKTYLYFILLFLPGLFLIGGILYYLKRRQTRMKRENKLIQLPLLKKNRHDSQPPFCVIKRPFVKIDENIYSGRFTSVWKCTIVSNNSQAALKIYKFGNIASWNTECMIYLHYNIKHENILVCRGAAITKNYDNIAVGDILSNSDYRKVPNNSKCSLNLLTEYHSLGCLDHYLQHNTINKNELVIFVSGICKGLSYLHSIISNSSPSKPCIVHRDIKCTNILVKDNGTCCISDFGLAIPLTNDVKLEKISQAGTIRYMAPEILDGCISYRYDSVSMIDIYSFALVVWEILTRCDSASDFENVFKRAYEKELGTHPTKEMAHHLIVKRKSRPCIKESWKDNNILQFFSELMSECWEHEAEARITASCILQRIEMCDYLNT